MNILVVDIGGTNVKLWRTGEADMVKFSSGKGLTAEKFGRRIKELAAEQPYDRVSIGYPGEVINGHPTADPYNLGSGWVDFDFASLFGCPIRMMNDACMQALGSYEGGRMLYLGLGTSIGTTFITDNKIVPLALGHMEFRGSTFENQLSRKALEEHDGKQWRQAAAEAAETLKRAFFADYVVIGGGNAKKLKELPAGCRRGNNANAYFGGIRLWEDAKPALGHALSVYPRASEALAQS